MLFIRPQNVKPLNLKIIIRYALLQIPELLLIIIGLHLVQIWIDLADWLFWVIILVMVIKDIILFPFLWPAYDWDNPKNRNSLLGVTGIARERLTPNGYIFINGELWMAKSANEGTIIEKDEEVIVTGAQGLTLYVQPSNKENGMMNDPST
jgi:membrane protein implicated in regulation of membrane protease activity